MAANFTLCMPAEVSSLGSRQPVLDGQYVESLDQAPNGTWTKVAFTQLGAMSSRGAKMALVHISTDAALRYKVSKDQPAEAGAQILSGVERTIAVSTGLDLWIK